jgi:thiamine biosynthesis lipoprotein
MRSVSGWAVAVAAAVGLVSPSSHALDLSPVHRQRYCMGTMFDIVVYHGSRAEAEPAIDRAMDEIARLDRVLSHYQPDSELSRLVRDAKGRFVEVDPGLFEVLQASTGVSRRSGGKFDVTIAPLVRVWREATEEGRRPTDAALAASARCVGYRKIELREPRLVRLAGDCVEIDLGGIGKGYAVDRAIAVLKAAGIRHALVNAGSSSIAALGAPPGRSGWPVRLNAAVSGHRILLLRDGSISTSQQSPLGEIVDPDRRVPVDGRLSVSAIAPTAMLSDALDTTLLMLSIDDGVRLLERFPGVSALWISDGGELRSSHGASRLNLIDAR